MRNLLVAHLNSFRAPRLDDALEAVAAAGYRAVELCAPVEARPGVPLAGAALARALARHGLAAVALSGHSDLTTEAGLARGLANLRWAADNGLGLLTTSIAGDVAAAGGPAAVVRRVQALAAAAEAGGVVVALEVHGPVLGSGARTRPWVEAIGSAAVRVKYDTANCEYYDGVAAVDDLHHVVDLLANVDVKDKRGGPGVWDFPPPGDGHIDWPGVLGILRGAGYAGPLTVEVEFQGEPWPAVGEVGRALRRAADTLTPLLG